MTHVVNRAVGIGAVRAGVVLGLCLTAPGCGAAAPTDANRLTPAEAGAGWQWLFDGKTLDGWRASETPGAFTVQDGQIVARGERSHLFYVGPVQGHRFRNFELQLEVKTEPGANSGVYFHTAWQDSGWPAQGYEVQVDNNLGDPRRTAGLYGVKDNTRIVARDQVWFTLKIRVDGKRITTYVDDQPVVDYTEEARPQRSEEFKRRLIASGTFALQAHAADSATYYRNIKVRPLP